MENLIKEIEVLRERALKTAALLGVERKQARAVEIKTLLSAPDAWSDREKAVALSKEMDELSKEAAEWEGLIKDIRDLEEYLAEAQREGEASVEEDARTSYEGLLKKYEKLEFFVLFSGKYDETSAILSIHAGTGGVDAQDWAEMLMRMFLRFAEKMGFAAEILDQTWGNEAGIRSVTVHVKGRWAYGYMKSESGVHRLVRISPFDAEAMRHTSFALVEVIPELPETADIAVRDEDLEIGTFRSSGPGGQNVNKVESAIRIKHKPSGIVVSCQTERSQHQNRESAMRILKSKLFQLEEEKRQAEELRMRGEAQKAEWGKQIRSYVLQPYQMVKDHRTGAETAQVREVLDGDLAAFMEAYLRWARRDTAQITDNR